MLNVIESIRMRLKRRVGCFGLYGYDFMIDEDMKVWLIEINVNPSLATNTNTLIQAIPPVVQESIGKIFILIL
jgi:D-alanine-D-alanine ligase-like ATP-grasp enzyme